MISKKALITALLPMKGHSERIHNKNLKLFCGNPLYHYIVNSLKKSKYISSIVIDTDSENIKADITKYFPEITIINRSQKNIGDTVPMNEIIAYDISQINADIFIQTHSTNPLLLSKTLDNAIHFFMNNIKKYDSVFSVSRIQSRLYNASGESINHNPEILLRTQDLSPVFEENSCFYIFTKDSFLNAGNKRTGLRPYMYQLNKTESIDIDEAEDFEIAETLFMQTRNSRT
ncbi:MAG: acylneuraminate cytidylyltransferase family protein [Bacteroidota bacterium]